MRTAAIATAVALLCTPAFAGSMNKDFSGKGGVDRQFTSEVRAPVSLFEQNQMRPGIMPIPLPPQNTRTQFGANNGDSAFTTIGSNPGTVEPTQMFTVPVPQGNWLVGNPSATGPATIIPLADQ